MKILVLDDKMLLVKDIIRDVRSIAPDAECVGFHRETEAIDYAREHPLDVALLDIDMPIMNGLAAAKRLCELQPKLNIIFLTGFPEYALDSYRVYASDFLLKPLRAEELKSALAHLRNPVSRTDGEVPARYSVHAIGANIKARRTALGMTVNDLAGRLDVSFQTVYRWESGDRTPDTVMLIELSRVLRTDIDTLISGAGGHD